MAALHLRVGGGVVEQIKIRDTFGKWTVVAGPVCKGKIKFWTCACVCGVVREIRQFPLLYGQSRGCGCGRVVSEDTKRLLSENRRQRTSPPRPKGSTHSEESKSKMSVAQKARQQRERAKRLDVTAHQSQEGWVTLPLGDDTEMWR